MTSRQDDDGTTRPEPALPASTDDALDDRGRTADDRDSLADGRDDTAQARDERSTERDQRAEARDKRSRRVDVDSASDRVGARHDREAAAGDRGDSVSDRSAAASDRALSVHERDALLLDALTGAYQRPAGFLELEREIVKAERTDQPFVLGFIDVDGLKVVNDTQGHGEGDDLLRQVVDLVRDQLREYDVVVRFGGDEFVCGLQELPLDEVRQRLEAVNSGLQETKNASISFGLVEREPGEELEALLARADHAMYEARATRRDAPGHDG